MAQAGATRFRQLRQSFRLRQAVGTAIRSII